MISKKSLSKISKSSLLITTIALSTNVMANSADPLTTYIMDGKLVGNWKANLSNALNWYIPVNNQQAKTERGNLVISPTSKTNPNDAINLKWKGKRVKNEWGGNALNTTSFTIARHNIDISSIEDQAALMIELKVNKAAKENTILTMQCNNSNKCQGKIPIKAALNKLPKGEWTQFPVPLNCFNKNGEFDFSKVTSILSIGTEGKLDIDIANIGLVALPPGSKGCKS